MDYRGTTTAILAQLDTCLPQYQTGRPRNTALDASIVEGILYKLTNNCKWRELPRCYPAWQTIYSRYSLWCRRGVWDALWQGLARPNADMERVSVDATLIRANHLANGSKYCPQAEQALGRTAGGYTTKIHAVVDAH